MNPQLSYRMAQLHQQDLYQASEHARLAREVPRQRWFQGFSWKRAERRGALKPARPAPQIVGVISRAA